MIDADGGPLADLAWMAPFALLVLYEETGRGPQRAVAPVGAALLGLGALVTVEPAWLPELHPGFDH